MTGTICGGNEEMGPWLPSVERWPNEEGVVYVGCCNRLAPIEQTESRWYTAFQGYVGGNEFRCLPDAGCNTNPGYKRTAHLRFFEDVS